VFRSPVLYCEHLAWLHVLVQVVDFVRKLETNAPPNFAREIVMDRPRRSKRNQPSGSMTPQSTTANSSHGDSARAQAH
jgi:hypothetical protein